MAKKDGDRKKSASDAGRGRTAPGSSGKGLKGSLTAMGTAAVLGVYAAGYARTEGAARQMEDELAARRLASAPPVVRTAASSPLLATAGEPPVAAAVSSEAPPAVSAAPGTRNDAAPQPARAGADAPQHPAEPSSASSAPGVAAADAPEPAPVLPAEPAVPASPYKDGVYASSGWETRHGHVDVRVEIAEGRITSASVMYCGMRWSCSDVNALMAQVPVMQTSEVGIVSGATQTSEAFTSAVAGALTLAKAARTASSSQ